MTTPFDTPGIISAAGSKVVAAMLLPSGLTTPANLTITGGTVTGSVTVPTGATAVYLGLAESPATVYSGTADIGGTGSLPDSTSRPYKLEARVVAGGTDMTSYSAIAAAFVASADEAYSPDVPGTFNGGMLRSGGWGDSPLIRSKTDQLTFTTAGKVDSKLTADGLDNISAAQPTGKPTTYAGWMMWLVQRFRRADMTATALTVKTEAGATVTTQTLSEAGGTQTVGAPS